ncbi:hypothetical protein LNQ81_17765 [Myroides sp. M-43]|uniref:hypothetical protein n=1 Tax=Myroides oncorhynchi TaxID=2893756 RepID=UPI001E4CB411|nr:hypothetical protein [Myroides oncorhynchi]MCC9044519.1 hypothetical protein [Myroides oncorhynchi]
MKKLILLFLATATLSAVGCSSDDGGSKDLRPEGYPEQINSVDLTDKKIGDDVVLTGKGFDKTKLGEYQITFVKKLPTKSSVTIQPRAPKPGVSDGNVEAIIRNIEDTKLIFTIPAEAGTGDVRFVYKKYETPIGNYQAK